VSRRDREISLVELPAMARDARPDAAMPEAVTEGLEPLDPILAPGVAAAALRELFEETGILPGGRQTDPERIASLRVALVSKRLHFAEVLAEMGLEADGSPLTYAGRWITPPLGPVRFDNRFFLLEWPPDEALQPVVDAHEATSGEWVRPAAAIERWRRGRVLTAPPILHLLQVLAEDGPVDGLPRLHCPEEANLGPFRRVEFQPGVLVFPVRTPTLPPAAFTNCYLLGAEGCVLVDPGSSLERDVERLAAAVGAARDRLGRTVREIWLTHHHPDHVGGAPALRERLGVPIAAHAETARRLAGAFTVDRHIEAGEVTQLGGAGGPFTVRALLTPGHARGHLCFLHEELGSLLAGDLVAGTGTIVVDPPEGNMQQYLDSIDSLLELAPRTLFPGHGPTLHDAPGRLLEYREHRRWREERIFRAWCRGRREPKEMLREVYDDVPPQAFPLAERQIVAHLERLAALGRLDDPKGVPRVTG
jgi:glyoxylase-like metal-dependent hydrolase (beta-lactamase superfamily II)/8-oxo-dGTP pyrophosphatase MutT (NUDIX family)